MPPRFRCLVAVAIAVAVMVVPLAAARAGEPAAPPDPARGAQALQGRAFLPAAWSATAYARAGQLWNPPGPDPQRDPEAYLDAFSRRYGLHPAPYPNEGLPMGLRRASFRDGRPGLALDCMVCHGGSIGGSSYLGLGNTQLDLRSLLADLTRADGQKSPSAVFTINSARGTNNAGQIAVALLHMRNPDLSLRRFPLFTGAWLPELDTPAWWILGKKATKYYDGRTDARAARSNMQFLLGDLSASELHDLEPTFQDIDAYLKSLRPPAYPFPIDRSRAERGRAIFTAQCARCHGTYGPDGQYPSKVVPIDVVGTDPARLRGLTDRFIDHYNATWLGQDYPVTDPPTGYQAPPLDGLWATAPYLHNGSVPTLRLVLDSGQRPARFLRPSGTDLDQYDPVDVGWKWEAPGDRPPADPARLYDTKRFGLGNQGHTFGDALGDDDRTDLIEYLKTL
jgi:hypothetical protein